MPDPARYGIVWRRPATCGNLWQWLATRWQRDGRTGLETRPTWQGLAMLEIAGNAGNCWQRWKLLATLEIAGNAGNCWQRWKLLATLEIAGNAGNCWQRLTEIT